MRFPAAALALVDVDEIELDEKVHRCKSNLTPCGIEGTQHLSQVAHSLLLRRKRVDERLARDEVFGPQHSEVATWIRYAIWNGRYGMEDVGPMNSRRGDKNLQKK